MDEGYGSCAFQESRFSQLMSESLLHFQDQRHFTACFVVMPNHVHAVMRPINGYELEDCLQRIKQFVSLRVQRALKMEETLWQQESCDRIIRDEEHLWNVVHIYWSKSQQGGSSQESVGEMDSSGLESGWLEFHRRINFDDFTVVAKYDELPVHQNEGRTGCPSHMVTRTMDFQSIETAPTDGLEVHRTEHWKAERETP